MAKDGIKLIFLGSGSAFTVGKNNYHSNMLLQIANHRMLIDCGSDVRFSLYDQGLTYDDVDDVYISHLHADHVGGLEWLGFTRKFNSKRKKPSLHISELLADTLWKNALSGGMNSLIKEADSLKDFFKLDIIGPNNIFTWKKLKFHLVKTIHIAKGKKIKPSFGLFFKANGTHVFITTDTQFHPEKLMPYYKKADVIFHDCETSSIRTGVHTRFDQLVKLDKTIKAKIWLYHYNPNTLPDAKKNGFRGFVKKGQVFQFLEEFVKRGT